MINVNIESISARPVFECKARIASQAIASIIVVGFAEDINAKACVIAQEEPIIAFNAEVVLVVSVAVLDLVSAVHLRNLAHSVQNRVSWVATQTGLGGFIEIGALRIDVDALSAWEIATLATLHT